MSGNPLIGAEELLRPKKRGDCIDGVRPCPWVGCKHHLAIDVTANGSIKSRRGIGTLSLDRRHGAAHHAERYSDAVSDDLFDMCDTCDKDLEDRGDMSGLDRQVAEAFGTDRKTANNMIRQAEQVFMTRWFEIYGEWPELPL